MSSSAKPSSDKKQHADAKDEATVIEDNPPPYEDPVGHEKQHKYDAVVKCSGGHLFTTIWVPLVSFKAVRLGDNRWQRCPVGQHWVLVHRVAESELTPAQLAEAAAHHDVHIP